MPITRSRILLWAALSGGLWALAWPAIGGWPWFAFIAWLPLLHAERLHERRTGGRRAFVPYVLLALFIWNLSCSWWFWCVSEPVATKLISVSAPVLVNTLLMSIPWWVKRVSFRAFGERFSVLAFVASWIAFERLHHDWDLQWPWFTIGNVFGAQPAMVQWYEYTGVLGGSLWVLAVTFCSNGALALWRTSPRSAKRALVIGVAFLVIPCATSLWRYNTYITPAGKQVEVVVVQPNIDPYTQKFAGVDPLDQLEQMLQLAAGKTTDTTALVLFPETALQESATVDGSSGRLIFRGLWENDLAASRSVQRLRTFQQEHPSVAMLCGMSSDRWFKGGALGPAARPLGDGLHWYEAYNAALWMPTRGPAISYHKSKLVTGPELVPFEEVLGALGDLSVDLGGTTGSLGQQQERSVLRDPRSGLALAPVICYESVFGEHVAAHVRNGANAIAIMTNDGWWSDSPGYKQHLYFASLRAIETRRCVVRSANTGISCTVDQRGVIEDASPWWTATALRAGVRVNTAVTFYVAHGDLIGRVSLPIALLLIAASVLRRLRRRTTA